MSSEIMPFELVIDGKGVDVWACVRLPVEKLDPYVAVCISLHTRAEDGSSSLVARASCKLMPWCEWGMYGRAFAAALEVKLVEVHSDFQGLGLGRILLDLVEDAAVRLFGPGALVLIDDCKVPDFLNHLGYKIFFTDCYIGHKVVYTKSTSTDRVWRSLFGSV